MRKICPLCGPVLSAFCMIMSVWGVIFLGLLGVFFYIEAVTLFPDLHFDETKVYSSAEAHQKYADKATQCWIAAGLYLVTLIGVFWQNKWNTTSVF